MKVPHDFNDFLDHLDWAPILSILNSMEHFLKPKVLPESIDPIYKELRGASGLIEDGKFHIRI